MELLRQEELPDGFRYPGGFKRLVERKLTHLEPWWVFEAAVARDLMRGLAQRYPDQPLVPFAKREDRDDVACFVHESATTVVVLHDFASNAWDRRRVFNDFYAWLQQAVADMIEFDRLEDE